MKTVVPVVSNPGSFYAVIGRCGVISISDNETPCSKLLNVNLTIKN